jgi:hypothetical protein
MSRPYLNAEKLSYSNPNFKIDLDYLRLRGGGNVAVYGLSSSHFNFTIPNSYSVDANGDITGTTFSVAVGTLGGPGAPGSVHLSGSHYLYNCELDFSIDGTVIQTYGFTFSY